MDNYKYSAITCTGLCRTHNEDNLLCQDKYISPSHEDFVFEGFASSPALFSVFDGIGGECNGEMASFLAAKQLNFHKTKYLSHNRDTILAIIYETNRDICQYAKENKISKMGATLAGVFFLENKKYIFNIGDSSIYLFSNGKLIKLSHEHSLKRNSKRYLTQALGIPEEEFLLSPHIAELQDSFDFLLLCSDGLTDMLSDSEIENFLEDHKNDELNLLCQQLKEEAYNKGATDNLSIILLTNSSK